MVLIAAYLFNAVVPSCFQECYSVKNVSKSVLHFFSNYCKHARVQ